MEPWEENTWDEDAWETDTWGYYQEGQGSQITGDPGIGAILDALLSIGGYA